LETAFYPEFQDAPGGITSSVYADVDTSEGTAYYVAITVDGVSGRPCSGRAIHRISQTLGSSPLRTRQRGNSQTWAPISQRALPPACFSRTTTACPPFNPAAC
jgi:hypothetical protein